MCVGFTNNWCKVSSLRENKNMNIAYCNCHLEYIYATCSCQFEYNVIVNMHIFVSYFTYSYITQVIMLENQCLGYCHL